MPTNVATKVMNVAMISMVKIYCIMQSHAWLLRPHVLQRCVFAHRSGERGHGLLLAELGGRPLLDLGLRLGEGSGAALAWPLLVSACAVLREMASFEGAGVSREKAGSSDAA